MNDVITLGLDGIVLDPDLQPRAQLVEATLAEYAEAMQAGEAFPQVVVFDDGERHWLADGFHRVHAAIRAGLTEISADVRQGSRRDALLFAVGANATHGLRRTNYDKRRAVTLMLKDPEWTKWSDREIARQCAVSHPFVAKVREHVTGNISSERTYTTKHGSPAIMNTAAIGTSEDATFEDEFSEIRSEVLDSVKALTLAAGKAGKTDIEAAMGRFTEVDRRIHELKMRVIFEEIEAEANGDSHRHLQLLVSFSQTSHKRIKALVRSGEAPDADYPRSTALLNLEWEAEIRRTHVIGQFLRGTMLGANGISKDLEKKLPKDLGKFIEQVKNPDTLANWMGLSWNKVDFMLTLAIADEDVITEYISAQQSASNYDLTDLGLLQFAGLAA